MSEKRQTFTEKLGRLLDGVAADDWGWWAGRNDEYFEVGPFATKDEAVREALEQYAFDEVEIDGEWRRIVFFAECRGLHYDCYECGIVPESCAECRAYLYPEESAGTFAATRNEGHILTGYDDEGAP